MSREKMPEMQAKFDLLITNLEKTVSESRWDYSYFEKMFQTPLVEMITESGENGIYRLVHATVNVLGQKKLPTDQPDQLASWLIYYFGALKRKLIFPNADEMAQTVETHLEAVNPTDKHDVRVRNITMLLTILFYEIYTQKGELQTLITSKLITFVEKVVIHNANYAQLFALMCLETFSAVDELKVYLAKQEKLKVVLHLFTKPVKEFNLNSVYKDEQPNVLRFRIFESAQALLDNVFGDGNSRKIADCPINLLTAKDVQNKRITRDNYSAFGCYYAWQHYQCSHGIDPLSGDVFYYEAILLTRGEIFVGWAFKMDPNEKSFEFPSKESISLVFHLNKVKAFDLSSSYDLSEPIKPCNVVGCLLDTSAGTFKFYLNGKEIRHTFTLPKYKLELSSGHYYPTVRLGGFQQVYFNFGPDMFRFAPSDVKFCDILEVKRSLEEKFGLWILDLEWEASNCSSLDYSHFEKRFETPLVEMMLKSGDTGFFRLVKAIVNISRQSLFNYCSTNQPDALAFWLFRYLNVLKNIIVFPDVAKVVQILETHIEAVDPKDKHDVRVRNICMLLTILRSAIYTDEQESKALFTYKITTFVGDVMIYNCDYAQLFALMCMEKFSVKDETFKKLNLEVVLHRLSQAVDGFDTESVYNCGQSMGALYFRIGVHAQWLLDHVFGDGNLPFRNCTIKLLTEEKFDGQKKVTRDNFSAFGYDNLWQNYQCSKGIDPHSGDVFYYEAILLTKGLNYIGWASKLDLESETEFPSKESISLNVFNKQNVEAFGLASSFDLPPIKPCDVVGCLLDTSNGTFKFYLNGNEILHSFTLPEYKLELSGPYYPTACLSAYQQLYFNFGQAPFRFAPDLTFCSVLDEILSQEGFDFFIFFLKKRLSESCNHSSPSSDCSNFEKELQGMMLKNGEKGFFHLVKSIVNILGQSKLVQSDQLAFWLFKCFDVLKSKKVTYPDAEKMAQKLESFLEAFDPSDNDDVRVRNICMVVSILLATLYTDESKALITCKLTSFIEDVVIHNSNYALLFSLICLEKFYEEEEEINAFKQLSIQVALHRLSQTAEEFNVESLYNREQSNVLDFRIGVYAQWLLDHLFGYGKSQTNDREIKLLTDEKFDSRKKVTRDNVFVFGYDYVMQNYQCSKGIDPQSGDVFYYEAILLTQGSIFVGWTLKLDFTKKSVNFYEMKQSVSFESPEKMIRTYGNLCEKSRNFSSPIKPGDVVGWLLDTSSGTFKVYLNGVEIPHTVPNLNMTSGHYYPTVCLSTYQQVYFNFGQAPFRFAPSDVRFRDICGQVHFTFEDRFNSLIIYLEKIISANCSDDSFFKTIFDSLKDEMTDKNGEKCFSQLIHSIINVLGQNKFDNDKPDVLAFWLFGCFTEVLEYSLANNIPHPNCADLAKILETHLEAVDPKDKHNVRVRNICMLVSILFFCFYNDEEELKALSTDKITFFVEDVVTHNSDFAQLFALMCLETLNTNSKLFIYYFFQPILRQLSSTLDEFSLETIYNREQSVVLGYRIGVNAQWLMDHVFGDGRLSVEDCPVKLLTSNKFDRRKKVTHDNYSAFGCDYLWQNFQCSQGIDPQSGDAFYYEAILVTPGSICVGWALKMDLEEESSSEFYDMKKSISFNAYEKWIGTYGKELWPPIKPCDVVGCLLDTSDGSFKFYLNGREVPHTWTLPNGKLELSSEPYYPTVCFSLYQQVYFNFGQAPFRFAPSDVKFRAICGKVINSSEVVDDIDSQEKEKWREWLLKILEIMKESECGIKETETNLIQPENCEESAESDENLNCQVSIYNFQVPSIVSTEMGTLADRRSELFYYVKQEMFFEWIRKLELNVREDLIKDEEIVGELMESLLELVRSEEDWIKLVQSMITQMGTSSDDRIDVMAMWMMSYINLLMPPTPDKVIQLVQSYLKSYLNESSRVTNEISMTQLRNIYILLSIMPRVYQYEEKLKLFLTSEIIINFLMNLASDSNEHKSSKLYALFCMQSFAKSCAQMKSLLKSLFKRDDFENFVQVQSAELTSNPGNYDLYQINFLSMWLLDYVFGKENLMDSNTSNVESAKVSRDGLSPVGYYYYDWIDYNYQSEVRVRPVLCSMYLFYEAILMTSGSARVGWALSDEDRKGNAQCSSIFFDAYQKCIYLDGRPHSIEESLNQPKPGTVIGCLLDTLFSTFSFYLDGDLIPFSKVKLGLSTKPYFPTVSLAAYQHVCINFGQTPFKFPPEEMRIQHQKVKED